MMISLLRTIQTKTNNQSSTHAEGDQQDKQPNTSAGPSEESSKSKTADKDAEAPNDDDKGKKTGSRKSKVNISPAEFKSLLT